MNKHEMSEQIYSKYRNWIGEFLSDLMKAVIDAFFYKKDCRERKGRCF